MKKGILKNVKTFDFRGLAKMIVNNNTIRYCIVVYDDGTITWNYNVDRIMANNKVMLLIDCPFYFEKAKNEKLEVKLLAAELRRQVIERVKNAPNDYWV